LSAFYDIWISDREPLHKRSANNNWKKEVDNAWLSTPGNADFIIQVENDHYRLLLLGQLYEQMDAGELLNRCAGYIEKPANGFDDPAGHYIIFVTGIPSGEVYVFTNRMGSYHAYWSDDKIISTNYLALARARTNKQLDWEALTGFMAMGYFPDDRTYLTGINIFEPASCYHFDKSLELIKKQRYWNWDYKPIERPADEYLGNLKEILQTSLSVAVKKRRTAIPISGGLDSRLLAGELTAGQDKAYTTLRGFSYGYTAASPEIKIARQVAAARNIPIYTYPLPNYLFERLDDITEAVELFQYVDGTRQASATGWLEQNADVVVGGHWGDVWMDSMNVKDRNALLPAFQKKVIKKGAAWLLENICRQHTGDSNQYLEDYFRSYIDKYPHIKEADFLMKIYKTDQWSFRWTAASLRMYQSVVMPVLPYYDKRIVDLFCTIPVSITEGRSLEIAYLKRYHNDLAKITWQEYDANLYTYKYFNNRNIAYRTVKKVQAMATKQKTLQRNWEVFYMNADGKRNLEKHLLGNKPLSDIVPQQKVKQLLEELYRHPTAANGYTVSMLLTFATFLDKVFK